VGDIDFVEYFNSREIFIISQMLTLLTIFFLGKIVYRIQIILYH